MFSLIYFEWFMYAICDFDYYNHSFENFLVYYNVYNNNFNFQISLNNFFILINLYSSFIGFFFFYLFDFFILLDYLVLLDL